MSMDAAGVRANQKLLALASWFGLPRIDFHENIMTVEDKIWSSKTET